MNTNTTTWVSQYSSLCPIAAVRDKTTISTSRIKESKGQTNGTERGNEYYLADKRNLELKIKNIIFNIGYFMS